MLPSSFSLVSVRFMKTTLAVMAAIPLALTPAVATAAAPDPVVTFTGSAIRQVVGAELHSNKYAAYVNRYLATNARRALSANDVRVYTVDATQARAEVVAVAEASEVPDVIKVHTPPTTRSDAPSEQHVAIKWHSVGEPATPVTRDAAVDLKYATRVSGACRDLYHNPFGQWPEAAVMSDCWEKYRSTRDKRGYIYNRYTTFSPARGGAIMQANVDEPTIRFRDWKGKHSIESGPFAHAPRPGENCKDQSQKISAFGAEVSIPWVFCSGSTQTYPRQSDSSFGVEERRRFTNQVALDAVATFYARPNRVAEFSDYVWYRHVQCLKGLFACADFMQPAKTEYKWTDGGW